MNSHKRICVLLLAGIIWSTTCFSQNGSDSPRAQQYKVALIYKLTNGVYWPEEAKMREFTICVLSTDGLVGQLNTLAKIRKFRNSIPIKIVKLKNLNNIRPCQMLIVDCNLDGNIGPLYSKIKGKPVFLVAENLGDYKKSILSLAIINNTIQYIVNKTKLDESGLTMNQDIYEKAVKKETDWKNIMEKFNYMLSSGDKNTKVDNSDVKEFVTMYKKVEDEKKDYEARITRIADSLNTIMDTLAAKKLEQEQVQKSIEEQNKKMKDLDKVIAGKKAELDASMKKLGEKDTVIIIIACLSVLGIILLLFTIRSNNQRRKANKLLSEQKNEIEKQKHLVDEKQKEILDSINYAKRIQTALMANSKMMNDNLPEHFVYFKPKDIVAGDFYWATPTPEGFVYITADSTGHGVPGAFMSLLNISKLNDAISQKMSRPDLVLNEVKSGIIRALNPEGSSEESKDGMDAILCKLDHKNMKLQFAAANNSFCIIRNKNIITCKADKMPVGKSHDDSGKFTFNELLLEKGDMIFTFTDGYGDQFGGPAGKKFKHKKLRDIFVQVSEMPINKQKEVIANTFEEWKGELEQVDDVLVIGVRV